MAILIGKAMIKRTAVTHSITDREMEKMIAITAI